MRARKGQNEARHVGSVCGKTRIQQRFDRGKITHNYLSTFRLKRERKMKAGKGKEKGELTQID